MNKWRNAMEKTLHLWRHLRGTATGVEIVLHATTPLEEKILGIVWRNILLGTLQPECRFARVRKKRQVIRIPTAVAFRYMREIRQWDAIVIRRPPKTRYKQRFFFAILTDLLRSENWQIITRGQYSEATGTAKTIVLQVTPFLPEVH